MIRIIEVFAKFTIPTKKIEFENVLYFFLEMYMENQINMGNQNTQQIGQNPVNQPTQIPEKPVEKSELDYKKITKIILFVLPFVILGFYFLNIQIKRKQFPNQPVPSTISPAAEYSPTTTVNNFKRFVNAKYKHYFDYPSSWEIDKEASNLSGKEFGQKQIIEEQVRSITIHDSQNSDTWFTVNTNEIDQIGNLKRCSDIDDCISRITAYFPTDAIKTEEKLLENRAVKITFNQSNQSNIQSISHLFVILNDDLYHFTMSSNIKILEENKKIFDQILSSFKLIYQTYSIDPKDKPIILTLRIPGSDNPAKFIEFKFSYKIKPNDVVKLIRHDYEKPNDYSSFEIIRKNARINISPAFEGQGITYDQIPEIYEFTNSKISSKPVYRVKSIDQLNTYFYVNYYAEGAKGCSQHSPLPSACSMSNIEGLNVSCMADINSVIECDDVVKTLEKIATEL